MLETLDPLGYAEPPQITQEHVDLLRQYIADLKAGCLPHPAAPSQVQIDIETLVHDAITEQYIQFSRLRKIRIGLWLRLQHMLSTLTCAVVSSIFWPDRKGLAAAVRLWNIGLLPVQLGNKWVLLGGRDTRIVYVHKDKEAQS